MSQAKYLAFRFFMDCATITDEGSFRIYEKDISIATYNKGKDVIDILRLEDYGKNKDGYSIDMLDNSYFVFINDKVPMDERMNVIIHEIGHILMGHTALNMILGLSDDPETQAKQEAEAMEFTNYYFIVRRRNTGVIHQTILPPVKENSFWLSLIVCCICIALIISIALGSSAK